MKKKIDIYCITHKFLKSLEYLKVIPFGVGKNKYPKKFLSEKSGKNIINKNSTFGELTFHYWFWKNKLVKYKKDEWFGICHYRRFFVKLSIRKKIKKFGFKLYENKIKNLRNLNNIIIKNVPKEWDDYNTILCDPVDFNFTKFSKFFKKNKLNLLKDPFLFFKKKKHNLKLHFEMFHGKKFLIKAIEQLPYNERKLFVNYLKTNHSLKANCMFLSNNKFIIDKLYKNLFKWLFKCEKIFKNEKLIEYGQKRIYVFLAERYIPFWLETYSKSSMWPWIYCDINRFEKKIN